MAILPHVDNIQDNGYFCGPATLQVLLGIRGVPVSEQQAAVEAHTTVEGTPTVEDIARVLNAHLGGAYRTVYIGGNSATPEQVAQLRADVTASIAAGYGVACNVVGQATGTLADGRTEINLYSGGHYLPVTGITNAGLPWCTDVADGHEYAMTWQALGDWIAGRGYATITAAKAAQSTAETDMAETFVVDGDGNWWFTTGDTRRKITQRQKDDIAYWHARAGRTVTTCMDDDGKHPKVFVGADLYIWGVDVATLADAAAPAAAVDAAAVAKELIANPDFAALLKQQAFEGAQEAETK